MSISGMEQMAYLARQADVQNQHAIEKEKQRQLKSRKAQDDTEQSLENSRHVKEASESDSIEALTQEHHNYLKSRAAKKEKEDILASKQRDQYYADPSVGSKIDISS